MDIINEQAKLDIFPHPHNPSNPSDHVIPQMVITSADDVSEEAEYAISPSNGHSTEVSNTSAKFAGAANFYLEGKPDIDSEDISVVVRDVVSKCTETVSHSVKQRPLVIEKNVQDFDKDEHEAKYPPPPPSPSIMSPPFSATPPASSSVTLVFPTTMQRPLMFDGVAKIEDSLILQKGMSSKIDNELICDTFKQESCSTAPVESESMKSTDNFTKKEGLHGVKKFFDSLLHHETQETATDQTLSVDQKLINVPEKGKSSTKKSQCESPPQLDSLQENKESSSFAKEAKHSIKSFLDTFKHESGEQTDCRELVKLDLSPSVDETNAKTSSLFTPESTKEAKHSTSFAKDTKKNIKIFFDNLKQDPCEQKLKKDEDEKVIPHSNFCLEHSDSVVYFHPESPKESTSFAKDAKQNIKAFFDAFKHETSEPKPKKSEFQPEIDQQEDFKNLHSSSPESPKTSHFCAKDTKLNIKAFFDAFKHESIGQKSNESAIKTSISQPTIVCSQEAEQETNLQFCVQESPKETSSLVKDTKHNIRTLLDSFKHEPSNKKKDVKILSQPDFTTDDVEGSLSESVKILKKKEGKNVKSFFDAFKPETTSSKLESVHEKSMDTSKHANLIVSSRQTTKLNDLTTESTSFAKDAKHNVKTFSDNFKYDEVEAAKSKGILLSKETAFESDFQKKSDVQYKGTSNPIKKLFSLKHSRDNGGAKFPKESPKSSKEISRDKQLKVCKSVTLDLNPQYSPNRDRTHIELADSFYIDEHDKEPVVENKLQAQPEKEEESKKKTNLISSLKKTDIVNSGSLDSPDEKGSEHKGFKKFFDSIRHGKSGVHREETQLGDDDASKSKEIYAMDLAVENVASKISEKPTNKKKGKIIKRSLSDRVNREEVVQNFKEFFDSISHKSTKKTSRDCEHIYDVVEIKSDNSPRIQIITDEKQSDESNVKSEARGLRKILSPFHSKDISKQESEDNCIPIDKNIAHKENTNKIIELPKSVEVSKASTTVYTTVKENIFSQGTVLESPKHEKSSMFNTIGENILALKEKIMHTKEKRKSELSEEYTEPSYISSKIIENLKTSESVACDQPSKESEKKIKPTNLSKDKALPEKNRIKIIDEPVSGPASLYNTCCIKLAVLLQDKAIDIVADRTKSPPPKPPKPSAEAIARARGAVVSKCLEIQEMGHSIRENIPISYEGIQYADDETESSCDYKDVENFDYIMDYELINRYKLDSSKFDTFSTDTGLTSYYTADTVTDIYSDAVMETISLSSDISHSLKYSPCVSKSDSKISTGFQESKKGKEISKQLSISNSPTTKKVPPPIPPKPTILQNISKKKGKSEDESVSQCVNGLSLSPRLQNKFSKDPAAVQKRPLMVADVKGTQFSSLQHSKPKRVPPKPARHFETVLKNESLKSISCITPPKTAAKTLPDKFSEGGNKKEDTLTQSNIKVEKRTLSPPRPPPAVVAKKPYKLYKPDRPPFPTASTVSELVLKKKMELKSEKVESEEIEIKLTKVKELGNLPSKLTSSQLAAAEEQKSSFLKPLLELSEMNNIIEITSYENKLDVTNKRTEDSFEINVDADKDVLNNNSIDAKKAFDDGLNNNIRVRDSFTEVPKPPPRYRRIRSRTVEIVPVEKTDERLKRSSSLSDIDVQKRVTFLNADKSQKGAKSLYTKINKNEKRSNSKKISQSSPDLVCSRPLPAPPPPPRRFRSLERKGISSKKSENVNCERNITLKKVGPLSSPDEKIRPPSRRRKTDKQRFFSLHSEKRKDIDDYLKRSMSVPLKPSRKVKVLISEKYDVNANIFNVALSEGNLSNLHIPKSGSSDSLTKSKNMSPQKRPLSSWYDECDILNDSLEIVDAIPPCDMVDLSRHNPLVPLRHKLDVKKKSKETSKFYVNMDEEPAKDAGSSLLPAVDENLPLSPSIHQRSSLVSLVDKETSPLPLDCSEKSVQTSLETLSQGIQSHDDDHESEDTDELLDLAQTLQKELSTIINRHKSVTESNEDTPSPPLSTVASERNLAEDMRDLKKVSSVRSSTSEVWPITSSDESDVELAAEDSSNVNEVALKRKQKKIFYIAREIMTSEGAFVDALKLLNIDFKAAVDSAAKQKGISIIPDEVLCQILNHLPQLQHLNENLLMELKDRIENWDKIQKIADIIVKMGPFLKLYSWYIHDFESNVSLLEDSKKKYPAFAQVVKEFEMSTRCKRLALNHYMLKPIQRIPQYRLLLQEYLHHMAEDSKDYQDTVTALQIVSEVANHANDSMKQGDNAQKLISIQNSIMGHKEIVKPGRVFVKEGELMKLSRKGMQPRWFVLFNDLLLYLTPVQQGLYRVNHELPLTGMKVAIPIQQDYQNEFSIISVTRSFTLAARSSEERQEWIIALTKAIEENASKRSTFTHSRLHQKAQDKTSSEDEGTFVLGKKAPVWIPDARVTMCQLCTSEFTVTFRRHHCRACGKVVCSICSSHRISLPYLGNRIARVCDECHIHLGQGSSACTESGETDSDNQQIAIKPHLRTDNRHIKKNKRMLPSVLKEVCANDQGSTISGYLHKKAGKNWKRDWFVVKDKVLYEYKASEDVAALRSTPLLGFQIESLSEALEGIDVSLLFQLTHPGQAPILFYADTVGSAERWISALKTATVLE